jgi:hypothetical protein
MFLADTLILYVRDSLNRGVLNLQIKIRRRRGAASIGARALRAKRALFCVARVRAVILRSLHNILLRWLAARARACGIGGLFDDRILSCSATRSCTSTGWKFNNGLDLQTVRVRISALSVVVFGMPVSRTAESGAADLGRWFFDTTSLRVGRIKASSLGGRFLCGLSKGVARVVLDGWSRGGRGLGAARTGGPVLCLGVFDSLVVRAVRAGTVAVGGRFLDRFALREARLRALAFGRLFGGLVFRTKRDNAGIHGRLRYRPDAFTRTPSQAETVLRGLVLGGGAVAAAGIQRSVKKGASR